MAIILLEWVKAVAPIVAPIATAIIAIYALTRQEVSAHRQWLYGERRDAVVDFLNATRTAYASIAGEDKDTVPADPSEESQVVTPPTAERSVEGRLTAAKHAMAVIRLLGPPVLATRAEQVMARIRLDRVYYAGDRDSRLEGNPARIIELAKETGDSSFTSKIAAALLPRLNLQAYKAAQGAHRLDTFWDAFVAEANKVLATPRGSAGRLMRALDMLGAALVGAGGCWLIFQLAKHSYGSWSTIIAVISFLVGVVLAAIGLLRRS